MPAPGSPPVARLFWTRRERLKSVPRAAPQRDKEDCTALPTHYLFAAIPLGGID